MTMSHNLAWEATWNCHLLIFFWTAVYFLGHLTREFFQGWGLRWQLWRVGPWPQLTFWLALLLGTSETFSETTDGDVMFHTVHCNVEPWHTGESLWFASFENREGGYVIWVRKCRSVVFPRRRTQKTHDVLKDDTAPVMSHRTVNKRSLICSEL